MSAEAGRFVVARPEIDHDRLAGQDRSVTHVVADRRLRAVRDDELVGGGSVLDERLWRSRPYALGRERRAVHDRARRRRSCVAPRRRSRACGHPRLGGGLSPANPGQLGGILHPPAVVEEVPLGRQLDTGRAKAVARYRAGTPPARPRARFRSCAPPALRSRPGSLPRTCRTRAARRARTPRAGAPRSRGHATEALRSS